MVTAEMIYSLLDKTFPFCTQEEWDNSGLLINSKTPAEAVLCCLDVTDEAIDKALKIGANVIVSHHPVIFRGIKRISREDIVYRLVKNDISVISAHTNFDKYSRGTCYCMACAAQLTPVGTDREIGLLTTCERQKVRDFSAKCREIFGFSGCTLPDKEIEKVFVCAGSGNGMKEEIISSGADCFFTGECKYHDMLDLRAAGIAVVQVGHDLSERISISAIRDIIKDNFKQLNVYTHIQEGLAHHIGE